MLNSSGLPLPFLITSAWRNFLVGCYSEAETYSTEFFGAHYVKQFRDGMAAFGTPAFLTDRTKRFVGIQSKKNRRMAERIVAMLTELRHCLDALGKTPILVDTRQYIPKYQNRTYQDMENQIARDLANAPSYRPSQQVDNAPITHMEMSRRREKMHLAAPRTTPELDCSNPFCRGLLPRMNANCFLIGHPALNDSQFSPYH
jgi:hypothetical protein